MEVQSVNRREKGCLFAFLSVSLPAAGVICFLIRDSHAAERYIRNCYYDNQDTFRTIVTLAETQAHEPNSHIKVDGSDAPDALRTALRTLREQYQPENKYPVFTAVDIYYDKEDDVAFTVQVKADRLKNGNGREKPDIRIYQLVYAADNYDGEYPKHSKEAFSKNWYIWGYDTYTG